MKRLMLIILVLLTLVAFTGPAAATPVDELTVLADVAPEDTVFFLAARLDDGYIDTLDALVDRVRPLLELPEEVGVRAAIEQAASEGGISFAEDIQPWLGATGALIVDDTQGVINNNADNSIYIAAEIADYDLALAYFEEFFLDEGTPDEATDSVVYLDASDNTAYLLTDEILYIGAPSKIDLIQGDLGGAEDLDSLANSEGFVRTMDALPAEEYNVISYINPEEPIQTLGLLASFVLGQQAQLLDVDEITEAVGQQAVAFTVLEERILTMDYAYTGPLADVVEPFDQSMLERAPDDTVFLITNQNLGDTLGGLLDALVLLDQFLRDSEVIPFEGIDIGPADLATFIRLSYEGTTGLDMDETLDWLNGDGVVFSELVPFGDFATLRNGFVISTDNPEATAAYVEAQAELALNAYNTATFEDGVLTLPVDNLIPFAGTWEIVLASNDEVGYLGAGDGAEFALEPSGDSVTTTDLYGFESNAFLDNFSVLWYINMEPVREVIDGVLAEIGEDEMLDEEELAMVDMALGLLDTASVTVSGTETSSVTRFTLTLPAQ